MKQLLINDLRRVLRLSEIERLIRNHRIISPPYSRKTLHRMCEDGTFDTVGGMPQKGGWLVYEDSFLRWIDSFDVKENAAR
jgi:hypothetical protein